MKASWLVFLLIAANFEPGDNSPEIQRLFRIHNYLLEQEGYFDVKEGE